MKRYWPLTAIFALTALHACACNPIIDPKAGPFEPCVHSIDCQTELLCEQGLCVPEGNDGGLDGGNDPCLANTLDCTGPDIGDQGDDLDQDGWGVCCECDDADEWVNPHQPEDPYNGKDDDCSPASRDDDLDRDGFDSVVTGGSDCDDSDPDVNPQATETCNGIDDNCDGSTDENLTQRACPLTSGVCVGTYQSCLGVDGWELCVYPPTYEEDEVSCDKLDNDCDGTTDEGATALLEPEWDEAASDGLDNNCNGLIDESGGVMVPVPARPGTWIDAFEMSVFESINCQGTRFGESSDDYPAAWPAEGEASVELFACSLAGVLPSGYLSWYRARRACEAQGKRLCTKLELEMACTGALPRNYPYGVAFVPGACNDPLGGTGHAVSTGSLPDCTNGFGTHDMSGNLAEWATEWCDQDPGAAVLVGYGFECLVCGNSQNCRDCIPDNSDDEEFIQNQLKCFTRNQYPTCFQRQASDAFFGGRCCLDGPDH